MLYSIATFNIVVVIIFNFSSLRVVNAGENDDNLEFCPPGATVNLTNAVRNNSGFTTDDELFFPNNLVNNQSGVLQGCICDVKPCITVCPTSSKNDETKNNGTILEPEVVEDEDDYVDYLAIPDVYDKHVQLINYTDDDERSSSIKNRFHVFIWLPNCYNGGSYFLDVKDPDDKYFLLEDGSLYLPQDASKALKPKNFTEYCLEKKDKDDSLYTPSVCTLPDSSYEVDGNANEIDKTKYYAGLLAVPFLIATVIVYSILPELNNIHGKTLRCYSCCMIVTHVAVAIDRIPATGSEAGPLSLSLGFTIYFSFLASFLWLNVMCFDMWSTFGGFGSSLITSSRSDRKKFIGYSIYVWGATSIMTAICVAMEFSPNIPDSMVRPGFQSGAAWFNSKSGLALYLYGPITITIVCNILMFISTAIKLYVHRIQTERDLNTGESRRHDDNKQWFKLFLKLFLVMGVTWSTEIISWLWEGPKYFWIFTDTLNAIQGIIIFVMMVCKPNIVTSLKKRLPLRKQSSSETRQSGFKNSISAPSRDSTALA